MRYAQQTAEGAEIAKAFLASSAGPARDAFARGDDKEGVAILTGGIVGKNPKDIPAHIMERRMENAKAARSLSLSHDEFPMLDKAELAALPMPVLLLSGADTAPIHAVIFKAVRAAMPKASAKIVKGSGHSVSQQQSALFNNEVFDFLSEFSVMKHRLAKAR